MKNDSNIFLLNFWIEISKITRDEKIIAFMAYAMTHSLHCWQRETDYFVSSQITNNIILSSIYLIFTSYYARKYNLNNPVQIIRSKIAFEILMIILSKKYRVKISSVRFEPNERDFGILAYILLEVKVRDFNIHKHYKITFQTKHEIWMFSKHSRNQKSCMKLWI